MEGAAADHASGDQGKEPFDLIQPGTAGRGEMEVESAPPFRLEPALDLCAFVRAVVIHDQVCLLVAGKFPFEVIQEAHKLATAVPEVAEMRPAARRSRAQQQLLAYLTPLCAPGAVEAYLRDIADNDRVLARQIAELLELIRQYGANLVASALTKAATARAFGADYGPYRVASTVFVAGSLLSVIRT